MSVNDEATSHPHSVSLGLAQKPSVSGRAMIGASAGGQNIVDMKLLANIFPEMSLSTGVIRFSLFCKHAADRRLPIATHNSIGIIRNSDSTGLERPLHQLPIETNLNAEMKEIIRVSRNPQANNSPHTLIIKFSWLTNTTGHEFSFRTNFSSSRKLNVRLRNPKSTQERSV